jgi:hypothetical protein
MDVMAWLAHATADAEARGLPQLKPLLESLARSLQALRDADPEFAPRTTDHAPRTTDHASRTTEAADGNDQAR